MPEKTVRDGPWPCGPSSLRLPSSWIPRGRRAGKVRRSYHRQSETWVITLLCDLKEVPALSGPQITHLSMGAFLTLYPMNLVSAASLGGVQAHIIPTRTRLCPGHHDQCLAHMALASYLPAKCQTLLL